MPNRYEQLEALINSLAEVKADQRVGDVLSAALREPQSAEAQLKQVDRVLEAFLDLGQINQADPRNLELLMTLGRTYDQFAYVEKSLTIYRTALTLTEHLGDRSARAELLRRMGKASLRLRHWQDALDFLSQSLSLYQADNDLAGQACVLLNRGIVYQEQGNLEQAQGAYEEAVRFAEAGDDLITVADAESNLAVLATIRGNFDDALMRYQGCVSRFEVLNDQTGLARTYHNMGMTHADLENWRQATQYYEKAFEIAYEAGLLDVVANVHLSRAELMLELGDTSMATTCCAAALDIYRQIQDALGEADSYRLLGLIFARRRQWETAESLFHDSIRLNTEFDNPLNVAETQRDLGRMYAARSQRLKARDVLRDARYGFEKLGAKSDLDEVDRLLSNLDDEQDV